MAYSGSTAGSSLANPPALVGNFLAGSTNTGSTDASALSMWIYRSTHLNTEVDAVGFITDGESLGMSLADVVFVIGPNDGVSIHGVRTVSSTGIDLSIATLVSSAS
jgi:hypothetical protein